MVAQWIESLPPKQVVAGSIPAQNVTQLIQMYQVQTIDNLVDLLNAANNFIRGQSVDRLIEDGDPYAFEEVKSSISRASAVLNVQRRNSDLKAHIRDRGEGRIW